MIKNTIKNKKGQGGLELYLLLLAIFLSIIYFLGAYFGENKVLQNYIGQYQFYMIKSSQEAEKSLFYIDQSAKYSMQQAIYDISRSGGISEIENTGTDEASSDYKCGKFKDSYVWYEIKKKDKLYDVQDCFDEDSVGSNLIYVFDQNLNKYISSAPIEIPVDNYNYDLKDNSEITGTANDPITFSILKYDQEIALPPLKPRQYKVDSQGKTIIEKKAAAPKEIPQDKAKATPSDTTKTISEDKTNLKSLTDFSGLTSDILGKETIDLAGLCQKGLKCSLTNDAYKLLLSAQKKAKAEGKYLQVNSAFRTYEKQKALWEGRTPERYAQRFPDPVERSKYVSDPDKCGDTCSHFTGNAVDVVFRGKTIKTMTGLEWKQLRSIMTGTGWIWYGDAKDINSDSTNVKTGELWHFECCETKRVVRAEKAGVTAIV